MREFAQRAFALVDLDWEEHVEINAKFMRLAEVEHLLGEPRDTSIKLGWTPKTSFSQLVEEMVEADLEAAHRELVLQQAGIGAALAGVGNE